MRPAHRVHKGRRVTAGQAGRGSPAGTPGRGTRWCGSRSPDVWAARPRPGRPGSRTARSTGTAGRGRSGARPGRSAGTSASTPIPPGPACPTPARRRLPSPRGARPSPARFFPTGPAGGHPCPVSPSPRQRFPPLAGRHVPAGRARHRFPPPSGDGGQAGAGAACRERECCHRAVTTPAQWSRRAAKRRAAVVTPPRTGGRRARPPSTQGPGVDGYGARTRARGFGRGATSQGQNPRARGGAHPGPPPRPPTTLGHGPTRPATTLNPLHHNDTYGVAWGP